MLGEFTGKYVLALDGMMSYHSRIRGYLIVGSSLRCIVPYGAPMRVPPPLPKGSWTWLESNQRPRRSACRFTPRRGHFTPAEHHHRSPPIPDSRSIGRRVAFHRGLPNLSLVRVMLSVRDARFSVPAWRASQRRASSSRPWLRAASESPGGDVAASRSPRGASSRA